MEKQGMWEVLYAMLTKKEEVDSAESRDWADSCSWEQLEADS
jgi:hypothetical protein